MPSWATVCMRWQLSWGSGMGRCARGAIAAAREATGGGRRHRRQPDRRRDWEAEPTSRVLARLQAADSRPGVLDMISGTEYYLFGGHEEGRLRGLPGAIIPRRDGAICRA